MSPSIKLSSPATREFWEIPVLYEDEQLLALNKPIGLRVSPNESEPDQPSLLKLLHEGIAEGKPWAKERGLDFLMSPHKLEPEIGGVFLLAKDKPALLKLSDLFNSEKPCKQFLVLVQGSPAEDRFESDAKLSVHPVIPGQMRVDPRAGKRSVTTFEVAERFSKYT